MQAVANDLYVFKESLNVSTIVSFCDFKNFMDCFCKDVMEKKTEIASTKIVVITIAVVMINCIFRSKASLSKFSFHFFILCPPVISYDSIKINHCTNETQHLFSFAQWFSCYFLQIFSVIHDNPFVI